MRLQREVHALLCEIHFKVDENFILPKCSTLVVLRHIHEDDETTKYGDEVNNKKQSDQGSSVRTKDSGGFRSDIRTDQLENQESPIQNMDPGGSLQTDQFWTYIKDRPLIFIPGRFGAPWVHDGTVLKSTFHCNWRYVFSSSLERVIAKTLKTTQKSNNHAGITQERGGLFTFRLFIFCFVVSLI
jgi:hypothetical protein